MTTEENEKTLDESAESADLKPEKPANKSSGATLVYTGLLLSVVALLLAAYNYQSIDAVRSNPDLLAKIDQLNRSLQSQGQSASSNQAKLLNLEQDLADFTEELGSISNSMQSLYNDRNRDETGWSLAEVEHLINIASLRITLEKDIDTALIALQTADNRLALLGEPDLFLVRRHLASEINALKGVTRVDITGLSLYLADIASRAESLPLKVGAVINDQAAPSSVDQSLPEWKRVLITLWYEFKSMFTITRTGGSASVTLLPDEKYFLSQNLRLQFESARLAALRHDTAGLRGSLQRLRDWLMDYYDQEDILIINILQEIDRMSRLELDPDLPNVGASLEALRNHTVNRNSGAPGQGNNPQ